MTRIISSMGLTVCLSCGMAAQSFDVASIRLHIAPVRTVGLNISGGKVIISAFSVDNLIAYAWNLKSYQVAGGPNWAEADRWDIAATTEGLTGRLSKGQVRQMLQSLLEERFQLQFHREMKETPVYALVRSPKGALKLKESAPDAESGLSFDGERTIRIVTTKGSMEQLVAQLSGNLDKPVIDRTGLSGSYDYKLEWAPNDAAAAELNAPSIFGALEEQLGLKLESTKAPVEHIAIDRVEKPWDN